MEQWMYWLGSLGLAVVTFFIGRKDKSDSKHTQEVKQDTTLSLNVQYIKDSVDKMSLEQKDTNRKLEKQGEEFTNMKIEQVEIKSSLKSLHKRVDRLDGMKEGEY